MAASGSSLFSQQSTDSSTLLKWVECLLECHLKNAFTCSTFLSHDSSIFKEFTLSIAATENLAGISKSGKGVLKNEDGFTMFEALVDTLPLTFPQESGLY